MPVLDLQSTFDGVVHHYRTETGGGNRRLSECKLSRLPSEESYVLDH
jgi:hypothetical protein